MNNLFLHLNSQSHRDKTPKLELGKLDEALNLLDPKSKNREEDKNETKKVKHEAEGYLQFIGFLTSINSPYAQIGKNRKISSEGSKRQEIRVSKNYKFRPKASFKNLTRLF